MERSYKNNGLKIHKGCGPFEKRDFFEKNYEILSELKIPHESGTAVSLIEKQLFLLREENQKINKQMCELIEIARQNNELALRMHQLILTLMGDNNPSETFSLMYESLKKNFHADKAVIRLFINPGSIYISTNVICDIVQICKICDSFTCTHYYC